ncbi:short chain dehydrogenase/ reductase [Acephala macrosclerotiorum]|nr:short chain dehydrogenase/ reductase [Acephala macrosclerotiorum]
MGLNLPGVAFVTGAGGSIGRAVVLQFARDGCSKIIGLDISQASLSETTSALHTLFPQVEFLEIIANMADEEQVKSAFERAVTKFGRIDYAVNNAAVSSPFTGTADSDLAQLRRSVSINLEGTWLCEREELRLMMKQELLSTPEALAGRGKSRGSIINIDSILGLLAMPGNGIYTITKHALLGMVKTDALDYAKQGIRVNAICPGFVDTPLVTAEIRNLLRPSIDKTPMGRLANAQEIADSVVFLASDRASYITGSSLVIDGGYTAQ